MNRVVISVPRVLDSAMVVLQERNLTIETGTIPSTVTAPFTVTNVQSIPAETQMQNIVITPLAANTNCSRVTANVVIPVTLSLTDTNGVAFQTHTTVTQPIDIVLFVPQAAAFPYTITSEACLSAASSTNNGATTTLCHATFKILTRITAITDLLIPTYGYAPINNAENYPQTTAEKFLHQPLFPVGKIY